MPEVAVLAYPAKIPLRVAARTKSDDRGFYRLAGLTPGRYWVRTGPHELEDGTGLLPTFAPETTASEEARVVAAELDREVPEMDLQPVAGRLLRLGGRLTGCRGPVKITLSSDTGRRETTTECAGGAYMFEGVAPGEYELLAESPAGEFSSAAHLEMHLDRDTEGANLHLTPLPQILVETEVPLVARRRDMAGEGESVQLRAGLARVLPGYWDMSASGRLLESIAMMPRARVVEARG
jgi:hypothetical protein